MPPPPLRTLSLDWSAKSTPFSRHHFKLCYFVAATKSDESVCVPVYGCRHLCALYVSACVCVCIHACVWIHAWVCLCIHVKVRGQPCVFSKSLPILFFETGISLSWNSPSRLNWLARKCQGLSHSFLCSAGITSRLNKPGSFMWILGVLGVKHRSCTDWNTSSAPYQVLKLILCIIIAVVILHVYIHFCLSEDDWTQAISLFSQCFYPLSHLPACLIQRLFSDIQI